jgi:hypothetical protein
MRFIMPLIIAIQLPSCTHKKDIVKETLYIKKATSFGIMENNITPPAVTVWVHGTILFYNSFYRSVFNKESGLFLANTLPENHQFHHIAKTIASSDPIHFPLEEFYIFAWSGYLSTKERKMAAEKLHQELCKIIAHYIQKYGISPVIRIIAHSHGGNVVLHMAKIESPSSITIKSLILLACPVQEKTMHLINMPMFEHIYSLYSSIDIIQVIAPQLRHHEIHYIGRRRYTLPGFSSRLFPPSHRIIQAKIKFNGFPITHTRFSKPDFIEILPIILQKLDSWDSHIQKERLLHKHKLLCIYRKN